jgi:uncharacterized protein YktA (UPF0223 family)
MPDQNKSSAVLAIYESYIEKMALLNHHKPFQHIVRTKEASRTFP